MFKHRIASATLWRVSEITLSEAASFAVFLIIARLVGPAEFGVVALATVCVAFAAPILSQGVSEALIQRRRLSRSFRDTAFCLNVTAGFLLALIAILLGPLLGAAFSEPRFAAVLAALSPIFVLSAASAIFHAELRRRLDFRAFAIRTTLAVVGGGTVGIFLAIRGAGVWALVGQQLTYNAIALVTLAAASPWHPRLRFRRAHMRDLISVGRHTALAALTDFVVNRADVILAALFLPTTTIALFYFAKRIVFAAGMFTFYSIQQIGLPVLSRRIEVAHGPGERQRIVILALSSAMLVCGPVLTGLALLAEPLIAITVGSAWSDAGIVLSILCMGALMQGLRITAGQILTAAGHPNRYIAATTTNAAAAATLVTVGAAFGLPEAALGVAAAQGLALPLALQAVLRTTEAAPGPVVGALSRAALPTLAVALALFFAPSNTPASLASIAGAIAAGGIAYLATAALIYARPLTTLARSRFAALRPAVASSHPEP